MEIIAQIGLFLVLENARINDNSSNRHNLWLDWISPIQNVQVLYFGSDHIHTSLHSGYDKMLEFESISMDSQNH